MIQKQKRFLCRKQIFISLFFVNQLSPADSNKINLHQLEVRLTLHISSQMQTLFLIIIHPQCFPLSHHLLCTPLSHPLLPIQTEVISFPHLSFSFPLPQTKLSSALSPTCEAPLSHHLISCLQILFPTLLPIMLTNNCAVLRLLCTAALTYLLVVLFHSVCCLSLAEFTVCRILKQKRCNYVFVLSSQSMQHTRALRCQAIEGI